MARVAIYRYNRCITATIRETLSLHTGGFYAGPCTYFHVGRLGNVRYRHSDNIRG